jgi:hypothetical protein
MEKNKCYLIARFGHGEFEPLLVRFSLSAAKAIVFKALKKEFLAPRWVGFYIVEFIEGSAKKHYVCTYTKAQGVNIWTYAGAPSSDRKWWKIFKALIAEVETLK